MFLTYVFLTHFGCVSECIFFVRTFVGTYVHFSSSNNMGKNEGVDQFPFDQRWAGEHVFSTPSGGVSKQWHYFAKCGFLLGKMVNYLKGQKKRHGRNKMDNREKDRRNLDIRGEGEAEERRVRPWTRGRRNKLPHMWILTNSYPPSFWAAWNIVQRLTVGDRRQTKPLETLGKDLSWSVWRHMESLHQRQRGRNTVLQEGE